MLSIKEMLSNKIDLVGIWKLSDSLKSSFKIQWNRYEAFRKWKSISENQLMKIN